VSIEAIHVNIWDDYHDDGFVPEGEVQETYAYVEGGDLVDDDKRAVLLQLQQTVESIKVPESALVCGVEWYDSALVYPSLVGTEHERHLYKRWQLQLKHLPHSERESLVEVLGRLQLQYNGRTVVVYSES
jgi:hypothetical protein